MPKAIAHLAITQLAPNRVKPALKGVRQSLDTITNNKHSNRNHLPHAGSVSGAQSQPML